jgi:plastocyanin
VRIRYPALAAAAVLLAACGGSSGSSKQDIAGVSTTFKGDKDVTGMSSVEIEADNFYFKPTVLKGTAGQKLTITIKNDTGTEHNFSQEAQHVNKDVEGGQSQTVQVTLPASGTISFFCEYHHGQGMAGGLQSG